MPAKQNVQQLSFTVLELFDLDSPMTSATYKLCDMELVT